MDRPVAVGQDLRQPHWRDRLHLDEVLNMLEKAPLEPSGAFFICP